LVYTGTFVVLSLVADILTQLDTLPPDPKRPGIVDRKVPGVIAILTLIITYLYYSLGDGEYNTSELAQKVQLGICSFSAIPAFLDIRWRDRFDYGPDE